MFKDNQHHLLFYIPSQPKSSKVIFKKGAQTSSSVGVSRQKCFATMDKIWRRLILVNVTAINVRTGSEAKETVVMTSSPVRRYTPATRVTSEKPRKTSRGGALSKNRGALYL